ncbi:MAG: phosphate acyltransferase PlsX [Lachnospiraceae bacterium]|nr:phosphate acyltransferase PlsX [Lachnospiraceae bacterium]
MDRMKITIDTLGGDNGSEPMVQGVSEALKLHDDFDIILVGNEQELKPLVKKYECDENRVSIINSTEIITCHDAPVDAIRKKKDSSLVVALNTVKDGSSQCLISAGNSGAILAGGQFIVGRAKGVRRTPLAPLIPTKKTDALLIDCGANVDAKPDVLVQFAKMGSIYMESIVGVKNPRVGIINIGTEDEKGNALVKETIPLLRECKDINFVGSIEARDIPEGKADVLVCEAFTGNCLLKFFEGVGSMFLAEIKGTLMSNFKTKIGALLIKSKLTERFKRFKADDKGGAPLLGLKGLVVKIHGNSKNTEVRTAIEQCRNFIINDVNGKIVAAFEGANDKE